MRLDELIKYYVFYIYFNPRTPYGMRLFRVFILLFNLTISIHAPLTGCDLAVLPPRKHSLNFNPRTPYGMRLVVSYIKSLIMIFQSTHPLRDATPSKSGKSFSLIISIHAPLTGCDDDSANNYSTGA